MKRVVPLILVWLLIVVCVYVYLYRPVAAYPPFSSGNSETQVLASVPVSQSLLAHPATAMPNSVSPIIDHVISGVPNRICSRAEIRITIAVMTEQARPDAPPTVAPSENSSSSCALLLVDFISVGLEGGTPIPRATVMARLREIATTH